MLGYIELVGAAVAYAVGNLAQTVAARRAERRDRLDPGLLARLAGDRTYVLGFVAQVVGFGLLFLARGTLPLYLAQTGSSAAVGLTAVLGGLLLGWRIRRSEVAALLVMAGGLALLAGAAVTSTAEPLSVGAALALLAALVATAALAVPAARLSGPRGGVAVGALAGVAFGVLAIAGRPLAAGPLTELPLQPTFWLMVLAAVLGQTLLATAFQRGSTTAAIAAMEASSTVLAAVAGILLLADQVAAGRGWWVPVGLALVVGGVAVLGTVVRPDSTPEPDTAPAPADAHADAGAVAAGGPAHDATAGG